MLCKSGLPKSEKRLPRLATLVESRMTEARRPDWIKAFIFSRSGSGYRRAEEIDRIYTEAAPLMNAAMTVPAWEFLYILYHLVSDAVEKAGVKFQSLSLPPKANPPRSRVDHHDSASCAGVLGRN